MAKILFALVFTLSLSSFSADCNFPGTPPGLGTFTLTEFAAGLDRPVKMAVAPGKPGYLFVVEQRGVVRVIKDKVLQADPFMDITDRVTELGGLGDERGFLGLTFHPKFQENGRLFVNYTTQGDLRTHVSEFHFDGTTVDVAHEKVLLEIAQPYSNHNGGEVAFGPDGYLYIGMGDGGSGGDPHGNGQNLGVLLAKMLRIDVDHGDPYAIPSDNPFVDNAKAKKEIFAYGLRNPWRFSFDRTTGDLWVGDVGQNRWEEIDIVKKGKNYGWNTMEGNVCYLHDPCSSEGLEPPIHVYGRSEGASVTGGFVYRGTKFPGLVGAYVFGDYVSGKIWGLRYNGTKVTEVKLLTASGLGISAFGEDETGELYVLALTGKIFQLAPRPTKGSVFPTTLSATGCFSSLSPLTPKSFLTAYTVNSPLWSDGAEKDRFVKVPTGQKIGFQLNTPWMFPEKTVLVKNFRIPVLKNGMPAQKNLETRFLVKGTSSFAGFTYRWNEEETEAYLLGGAQFRPVEILDNGVTEKFNYYYPSPTDCNRCHTPSAGEALGVNTLQLNKQVAENGEDFDPEMINQIHSWMNKGILKDAPDDLSSAPALPDYRDVNATPENRSRAMLHSQCANCHNPQATVPAGHHDLRYQTTFAQTKICNVVPEHGDTGVAGAKLLTPRNPEKSLVWTRAHTLDTRFRMPPLGTSREDKVGTAILAQWIQSITDCP